MSLLSAQILFYAATANLLLAGINLIPLRKGEVESDGMRLKTLLMSRAKREERTYRASVPARVIEIRALAVRGDVELALRKTEGLIRLTEGLAGRPVSEKDQEFFESIRSRLQEACGARGEPAGRPADALAESTPNPATDLTSTEPSG